MSDAIRIAKLSDDDAPIGCIIVQNGFCLAKTHNKVEAIKSPIAHAEILCINEACVKVGRYLDLATLYCTLEPCPMCAEAIRLARINRVVFGAFRNQQSCVLSNAVGGICEEECNALLKKFFAKVRIAV